MPCRRRIGADGSCRCRPAGLNLVALGICRDAIFGGKKGQFYYLERKGSRSHKWQQLTGCPLATPWPWPSFTWTWLSFLFLQRKSPTKVLFSSEKNSDFDTVVFSFLLSLFQIVSHSKNLGESKYFHI